MTSPTLTAPSARAATPSGGGRSAYFITAIGTPLDVDDQLHEQGLEAHLADQIAHGMHGLLVAGSMGLMQLLTGQTYRRLVQRSIELFGKHGEILVGAGDTSFARTRQRIEFLNTQAIDGIAILTPFFAIFAQDELLDYYRALADVARKPVYLYDVPVRTHCKLEAQTVVELARHPNIAGIKCSDDFMLTRQLMDMAPAGFRVIVAQPDLIDVLLRHGVQDHLDGMWAIAPGWTTAIARHVAAGDFPAAARPQQHLSALRNVMFARRFYPCVTAIMNRRGIPGSFAPRPYRPLSAAEAEAFLDEPVVRQLLAEAARRR